MRKMKTIVFVVEAFPVLSQTFIVNHIISCIEAGYNIRICTRRLNDINSSSQQELILKYKLLDKTIVRIKKTGNSKFSGRTKLFMSLIKNFRYCFKLFKLWKSKENHTLEKWYEFLHLRSIFKADIIHIQFANSGVFLFQEHLTGLVDSGTKLIVTSHGYDVHLKDENIISKGLAYEKLFAAADYVIVNSNYLLGKVTKLGCNTQKINIIPISVDTELFSYNILDLNKSKVRLISVGRLISIKGHIYGIKVVEQLLKQGLNIEYVIVGDGILLDDLNAYIVNNKLNPFITLVGLKSQNEINILLEKADIFLMTSTTIDNVSEAFGLVVVEAQAKGLPVVAFDSGGVRDTIIHGETGLLVKDKSVDEMVEQIHNLVDDKNKYRLMSSAAVKNVKQKFAKSVVMNKHKELYES